MQTIKRYTPADVLSTPLTTAKPSKGLFARWERVDGKLTSMWLKHPD